jgi:hypothetical protein
MFSWIEEYIKAGSPKVSPKLLAALARSVHSKVRLRVAENPNTPEEVLSYLAQDRDAEVRIAVATAGKTPARVVQALARDSDPTVRHGIAEDVLSSIEVLRLLAEDDNAYVSCRAKKTLESLQITAARASARRHTWATSSEQCFA